MERQGGNVLVVDDDDWGAAQAGRGLERAQSPRLAPVAILTVATSLRGFATYNRYPSFNA